MIKWTKYSFLYTNITRSILWMAKNKALSESIIEGETMPINYILIVGSEPEERLLFTHTLVGQLNYHGVEATIISLYDIARSILQERMEETFGNDYAVRNRDIIERFIETQENNEVIDWIEEISKELNRQVLLGRSFFVIPDLYVAEHVLALLGSSSGYIQIRNGDEGAIAIDMIEDRETDGVIHIKTEEDIIKEATKYCRKILDLSGADMDCEDEIFQGLCLNTEKDEDMWRDVA